jgi:uncharacterized protein YceK
MSIVSQMGYWTDSSVGHMTDPDVVIYGGTRITVPALYRAVTTPQPPGDDTLGMQILFAALLVIDLPFTLVVDTVLLPLTCAEEWWTSSHAVLESGE